MPQRGGLDIKLKIFVTGGAGFIGSAMVRHLIDETNHEVVNIDAMTYAAMPEAVADAASSNRYSFEQLDIRDGDAVMTAVVGADPDVIVHLAAETHVDRSIDDPSGFVMTNIVGTYNLLDAAREQAARCASSGRSFRFHHVSTDEVFGSLGFDDPPFSPASHYAPRSPYSASKAASDHLVRAWSETYGLPAVISNCSNNYGAYQFPEKLIPLTIIRSVLGKPLPVYGKGENIRDWIFVDDHVRGIVAALETGTDGETYFFGGNEERTNLEVVETICDLVDEKLGLADSRPRRDLISFVADRPGHDLRYAVDSSVALSELGWKPDVSFSEGLARTVDWYLANREWWGKILDGRYDTERLGSGKG